MPLGSTVDFPEAEMAQRRTPLSDQEAQTETGDGHSSPTGTLQADGTPHRSDLNEKSLGEKEAAAKEGQAGDRADVVSVYSAHGSGEIQYKTMTWKTASGLLFGEYVCLAILSVPGSFATLGMAGGLLTVFILGIVNLRASHLLWQYCRKHPQLIHIGDIAKQLLGGSRIAYEVAGAALCINNVLVLGFHTLTGAEILNTLAEPGSICTVGASLLILFVGVLGTLPRQMEKTSILGMISAVTMFISIILTMAFSGAQDRKPAGWTADEPVRITAFAPEGTTFVQGLNALLNILFLWVGNILYPSFISEMKNPEDFPKALYAVTIAEFVLFSLTGIVVYYYAGQYTTAPAVAVLDTNYKKAAFSFVLPTTIIIGCIYAAVVCKYLFVRCFGRTRHFAANTWVGWSGWIVIVVSCWVCGWIVGEAVPFFSDLLSLISALFAPLFGYAVSYLTYYELRKEDGFWRGKPLLRKAETVFQICLVFVSFFVLGVGSYTSVEAIILSYAEGGTTTPFTCASDAI